MKKDRDSFCVYDRPNNPRGDHIPPLLVGPQRKATGKTDYTSGLPCKYLDRLLCPALAQCLKGADKEVVVHAFFQPMAFNLLFANSTCEFQELATRSHGHLPLSELQGQVDTCGPLNGEEAVVTAAFNRSASTDDLLLRYMMNLMLDRVQTLISKLDR